MLTNRENILVSKGDLALVPVGTKLYNTDGSMNILPGQLGIFNASNHIAVDATSIVDKKNIYFAVGVDTNGNGVADSVRKSAGEIINKCSIDAASAEPPREECPEIWDFAFNCVECNDTYSLKVQADGVEWWPFFEKEHLPTFKFPVVTTCCSECGDNCDEPIYNCSKWVEEVIEMIEQKKKIDGIEARNLVSQEYPFIAVPLSATIAEYTIPCINGMPAAIKTISVGGDTLDGACVLGSGIFIQSNGTMNPGQFGTLENYLSGQTNNTVKFKFIQACTNGCWKLIVTGASEYGNAVVLNNNNDCSAGATTAVTPTTLAPLQIDGVTYNCGIRFIGKIYEMECGCFPPKEYRSQRGTKLRVFPSAGFGDCGWATQKVQDLQVSEGQGVDLRWREYRQQLGGAGRTYDSYHMHYGKLGVYGDRVREAVTSECTTYCQYEFIHHSKSQPLAPMGWTNNTYLQTTVAIPSSDSTTKTAFENVINAWIVAGTCPLNTVSCDNDSDEVNSNLDFGSGNISNR